MATKRVRTGCLKCRVRRRKCDEGKPRCQRCIAGGFECQYGTRLSFLAKNTFTVDSPISTATVATTPSQPLPSPGYHKVQFVDLPSSTPKDEPSTSSSSQPGVVSPTVRASPNERQPSLRKDPLQHDPSQGHGSPARRRSGRYQDALDALLSLGTDEVDNGTTQTLEMPTTLDPTQLSTPSPQSGPRFSFGQNTISSILQQPDGGQDVPMLGQDELPTSNEPHHLSATNVMSTVGLSPMFYTTAASATTPSAGEASSPSFAWKPDEFALDQNYQAYREELRELIFTAAQSAVPTREGSPVANMATVDQHPLQMSFGMTNSQTDLRPEAHQTRRETAQILSAGNNMKYLKNYMAEVAPWLDMFDSDRAFGLQLSAIARTSPALLYAILGISARQLERKEGKKNAFDSLELYQEAIRLLAPLLLDRDLIIIPICVILCCLEMMSASAQDWRRHLEGCAALFSNFGVHGFSGGLLQAVFWCYARMDLCGALISDGTESTMVPSSKWLPPGTEPKDARQLFMASQYPDMYANYSVWLASRVCELVADRTRFRELGVQNGCTGEAFTDRWVALWRELEQWAAECPPEFKPVRTVETRPFPQPLYAHWATISSTQLHHTSCLLLLGMMPKPLDPPLAISSRNSVVWHAKKICGISLANAHQGCLNNAIQPLWLAGRLLSHRSEHELIVKMIWSIEALTGWGMCWRINDLESTWGYKVRRI